MGFPDVHLSIPSNFVVCNALLEFLRINAVHTVGRRHVPKLRYMEVTHKPIKSPPPSPLGLDSSD